MKKLLFISGVARSGTSALVRVLNSHPGILVGQERYFFRIRRQEIGPEHFEKERFYTLQDGDTHGAGFRAPYDQFSKAYDAATYVGDKFPLLYSYFDYMFETFPDAAHIYIFRNPLSVIESYHRRQQNPDDQFSKTWLQGLEEWNESLGRVARMDPAARRRFHLVQYEKLFASPAGMNALFRRLGLSELKPERLQPFADRFSELNETSVPRQDIMRQHVALNADWDAYRTLYRLAEDQQG